MAAKSNYEGVSLSTSTQTNPSLTTTALRRQSLAFRGTGGTSEENQGCGFAPAFLDTETGNVYLARFADGRPAPMHVLDGLPDELVVSRLDSGRISAIKATVIAGFLRRSRFFTREQAARAVRLATRIRARLGEETASLEDSAPSMIAQ